MSSHSFNTAYEKVAEAMQHITRLTNPNELANIMAMLDNTIGAIKLMIPTSQPVHSNQILGTGVESEKIERLSEKQYLFVKRIVDNGSNYTSLNKLIKEIYVNDPPVHFNEILNPIRRILRYVSDIHIMKEPKQAKTKDTYRVRKSHLDTAKAILSDPWYSGFADYKDYSVDEKYLKILDFANTTDKKAIETEAIKNAIPISKTKSQVCRLANLTSSGSNYEKVDKVIADYNLTLGSAFRRV